MFLLQMNSVVPLRACPDRFCRVQGIMVVDALGMLVGSVRSVTYMQT